MDLQAVVLAGGAVQGLQPLVSQVYPSALLPVGNRPLLCYPIEMLERAGFTHLILVVAGEEAAARVGAWASEAYQGRVKFNVAAVPEETGSADALRAVSSRITSKEFLVVSGDVVCDIPLGAVVAAHRLRPSVATALLAPHREQGTSSEPSKKKDKAALPPDIMGLDKAGQRLLCCAGGKDAGKEIRFRKSMLRLAHQVTLHTGLADLHVYVFARRVLEILHERPTITSIKAELLPLLVRLQDLSESEPLHTVDPAAESQAKRCSVYVADGTKQFCARINNLQAYGDVNHDILGDGAHLLDVAPSPQHGNFVDPTAEIGTKTMVGAQCMIGAGTKFGDRCSIKRSVVGRHCRIGNNVKIVNSVIMHHVVVDDNCVIQGSVICNKAHLFEKASLKDCFVAPALTIAASADYRGQSLDKKS
eukprot:jgi/Chlat1/4045/Chrsp26S04100